MSDSSGRSRVLAVAAVQVVCAAASAQPISAFWLYTDGGEWEEAGKWSTSPFYPLNGQPVPSDTYDVFLDAIGDGDPYTLQLDVSVPMLTVDSITMNAPNATLKIMGSDVDMEGGPIVVNAGVFQARAGALRNAVVETNGGAVQIDDLPNAPTFLLDGITLMGDPLVAEGVADVVNGLSLQGTWAISHEHSVLLNLVGDQTIEGGTFSYDGTDFETFYIGITDGSTVQLSPPTIIEGGGYNGLYIGRDLVNDMDSDNTLVNHGTILANEENHPIEIWSRTFINEGLLEVADFGVLSLSWTGDYFNGIDLDADWTNNGTIRLTLGTINLAGTFTTADLGTVERAWGSINLLGTMNNTGATFDAAHDGTPVNVDHGTIIGGTLDVSEDGLFIGTGVTFQDVTFNGDLSSDRHSCVISFVDSVTLGNEFIVEHDGVQITLDMASLDSGAFRWNPGASGAIFLPGVGEQFTLGAGAEITGSGFDLGGKSLFINEGLVESTFCDESIVGTAFRNEGIVRASGCGDIRFLSFIDLQNFDGDTLTGGTWEVNDQGVIYFYERTISENNATIIRFGNGATIPALDELAANFGELSLQDGADQSTKGALENGGLLNLGSGSIVSVAGTLTLTPESTYRSTLSAAGSGTVAATDVAQLGGKLEATLAGSYEPSAGDIFTIVTGASIEGAFKDVVLAAPPPGLRFVYAQDETSVRIIVTCSGDFNGDGALNILDFVDFQSAFKSSDPAADCSGDGKLNILDFVCFQEAFGQGC